MKKDLKILLNDAAVKYETATFIETDPIQFPHRYCSREDVEVSAFIAAWMAYGSRKVFLKILDSMHSVMDMYGGPFSYIMNGHFSDFESKAGETLYRFYK